MFMFQRRWKARTFSAATVIHIDSASLTVKVSLLMEMVPLPPLFPYRKELPVGQGSLELLPSVPVTKP